MSVEQWRPIPGWEGEYSVSSLGRVRSEERFVEKSDGKRQPVRECVLTRQDWGRVFLSRDGKKYSVYPPRLVAKVFGRQDIPSVTSDDGRVCIEGSDCFTWDAAILLSHRLYDTANGRC